MNYQKQPNLDQPKIIQDSDNFFIVYKPKGWIVYDDADAKYPKLSDFCVDKFDKSEKWQDQTRKGFVHRIDVETSGILLVAKNREIFDDLQKLFRERLIEKWYLAVVHGDIPEKGIIDSPIERKANSTHHKVSDSDNAKESQSVFYKVSYSEKNDTSLVAVYLHTGRTHQIRTHFSSIKHAVLGDKIYSKNDKTLDFMYLLSYLIDFEYAGKQFTFVSPIPYDFMEYVKMSYNIDLSGLDISTFRTMLRADWDVLFKEK